MSSPDKLSSPDGEVPPTQAIIEAIAAHEGVDVTEVEPPAYDPLFTVVNPEALDKLFRTTASTTSDTVVRLEYEGYEVVVRAGGNVVVRERSRDDSVDGPDPIEE
ncbi:HalOD1 output domain-containing protein [Natrinema sp. 74]|uniref:HalOD1 output domain-containing protein n=1 Tax=Natrinema sp. 74 TaxID=3384159 RepID=UPI0038D3BB02